MKGKSQKKSGKPSKQARVKGKKGAQTTSPFPLLKLVEHSVGGEILVRLLCSRGSIRLRSICKAFENRLREIFPNNPLSCVSEEISELFNKDLVAWLFALPEPPLPEHVLYLCAQQKDFSPEDLAAVSPSLSCGGEEGGMAELLGEDADERGEDRPPGFAHEAVQQMANLWATVKGAVRGGNEACLLQLTSKMSQEIDELNQDLHSLGKRPTHSAPCAQHNKEWATDCEWYAEMLRKGLFKANEELSDCHDGEHTVPCAPRCILDALVHLPLSVLEDAVREGALPAWVPFKDRFHEEDVEWCQLMWVWALKGETGKIKETAFPLKPPPPLPANRPRRGRSGVAEAEARTELEKKNARLIAVWAQRLLSAASAAKANNAEIGGAILEWFSGPISLLGSDAREHLFNCWKGHYDPDHLVRAAARGDTDFLEKTSKITPDGPTAKMSFLCTNAAARGDHIDTFAWLLEHEVGYMTGAFAYEDVRLEAAEAGSLGILKWLREDGWELQQWPWRTCKLSEDEGHFETLRFLRSADPACPWGGNEWSPAAGFEPADLPVEVRLFEVDLAEALSEDGKELPLPPPQLEASVRKWALYFSDREDYFGPLAVFWRLQSMKPEIRLVEWFLKVGGASAEKKLKAFFEKRVLRIEGSGENENKNSFLFFFGGSRTPPPLLKIWLEGVESDFTNKDGEAEELKKFAMGGASVDSLASLRTGAEFKKRLDARLQAVCSLCDFAEKTCGVSLIKEGRPRRGGQQATVRASALSLSVQETAEGLFRLFGHPFLRKLLDRLEGGRGG